MVYQPGAMRKLRVPLWKRILDVVVSLVALCLLSPLFALAALLIKLESKGPVFFRQVRVGQGLRSFRIWKFRTMVADAPQKGAPITAGPDPRITGVGRFLRRAKIDELPQLINVLCGDMSLVGPRPEVPRYVEMFRSDYEEILRVPPGITDFASVKYRDEATVLMHAADPEREYVTRVLPDKIQLAKEYVHQSSFFLDVSLIARTVKKVFLG
jgi:lipopolysaccharide/colanic/teichoic acid biosynthesis glycosyltransferase